MSWGNNLQMDGAPRVCDYASALAAWEKAATWRNEHDYIRVCTNRRCHNKQIINRAHSGAISFKLFGTEVVTYYADGEVVIDPYRSSMTDTFADYFLPDGVRGCFKSGAITIMRCGDSYGWETGRYYQTSGTMRLKPADGEYPWEVVNPHPWERKHVDKAKMRVACEEAGYNLFRDTCHAYFGLQHHMGRAFDMPRTGRDESVMDILKAGPEAWGAFMVEPDPSPRYQAFDNDPPFVLGTILKKLRQDICLEARAYTVEQLPYVVGSEAWQRLRFSKF